MKKSEHRHSIDYRPGSNPDKLRRYWCVVCKQKVGKHEPEENRILVGRLRDDVWDIFFPKGK